MMKTMRAHIAVLGVFVAFFVAAGVQAQDMSFDLAQDQIQITTGFNGSNLTVFGAKTRPGDVIVTLEGPKRDNVVRRKENILGAWINRTWFGFEGVPSYYDFALSSPDILDGVSEGVLSEEHISLKGLEIEVKDKDAKEALKKEFREALIRTKQGRNVYPDMPKNVVFVDNNLFRVDFVLPAHVPVGDYTVRSFLFDKGKLLQKSVQSMKVEQVGLSSEIYLFAKSHSFVYGVLCVFIACVAGWLSNVIVKRN